MKFFDCFMYHDEDLILDIRFNTLDKYIDKFVIVESKFDHQGNNSKSLRRLSRRGGCSLSSAAALKEGCGSAAAGPA